MLYCTSTLMINNWIELGTKLALFHVFLYPVRRAFGPSGGCIKRFHSYLASLQHVVWISGIFVTFGVLSCVLQWLLLGPLRFDVYVNDFCNVIQYTAHLFFFLLILLYKCLVFLVYVITLFEQDYLDSTFTDMNCYCLKFNSDVIFFMSFCGGLYFVLHRFLC